ncbi:adenosylcobinamide-phosphate synthase CbiB [Primorskyibacter marinus]|uniref:adenosylcobinamide-phosphate synthase CbiB n=1 Tax=Primorskyibacter marinus TaxID=1977320 RepID=UPI000E307CF6|nr:adenosylcobinamide-phosphate synthase CbiB [Primorskyibacter marinus]
MSFALMILIGTLIDICLGWPAALYARIGHPVGWIGKVISECDERLNHGGRNRRMLGGLLTVAVCLAVAVLPALALQMVLPDGVLGLCLGGLLAWPLIALRSMHDHVHAVARPLVAGDLVGARRAVSMIVGRDPAQLDQHGVARAAIESLGENTSDGIVAPVFWGVVAGLPGIVAYKVINTLDSMIGHKSERYEAFGKVAARLDDVANWIPARLTAGIFALAAGRNWRAAMQVVRRDAHAHRSPNAGWPEGAVAGALRIRLSGPRSYGDITVSEPWLNAGAPDPTATDLMRALHLYRRAMAGMVLALLAIAVS